VQAGLGVEAQATPAIGVPVDMRMSSPVGGLQATSARVETMRVPKRIGFEYLREGFMVAGVGGWK
jgi:hypothetical protein